MEELAAWRYLEESFEQIRYGLRVGPWPRWIGSTTPKGRQLIKKLNNDPKVVKTYATTADNPHLDENVRAELYEDYEGTRMGRQELLGQILEDVEGALWTGEIIELARVGKGMLTDRDFMKSMKLVTVAIDPAATASETSDETGIITVGMLPYWDAAPKHPDKSHAFVFDDRSGIFLPTEWARKAITAYKFFKANRIVGEINNGGEMVKHTIHSVEDTIPFKMVTATRGKARRAEPVSSLYAEERVHHVGMFPRLEDQMTTWDPENPDDFSPDRMDAMVYAVTDTMIGATIMKRRQMRDRRLKGRR